ncbi:histidine kinase [Marinobacter vulgaris]|uniref:histidine kinase n=1 Tax=Marinobacter vulgaris TaxID=1928331 RepID=A0A2V3ZQR8_9GAMM|nr:sensor histidine kinase [Marinobacter vulgaris]PXX93689.1 histidine kinase [Marinobacter vulgaris]TSJ72295.1 sensor histidine kinase [Marinobacter vulgaris]
MHWIDPRRSIRKSLLTYLLPAAIALMTAAWVVHGLLLERMAQGFVEDRLQDEVAFLEHQLRQSGPEEIRDIAEGDYFEKVFHHAFALRTGNQVHSSPAQWSAALEPLLNAADTGFVRISEPAADASRADFLAYRKALTLNGETVVIVVAEDLSHLQQSQQELHLWTAVVSAILLVLLILAIWLAIRLSLGSVNRIKQGLTSLQSGASNRLDVEAPTEFQPLIGQLNQLLDTLDQRLSRSRDALANLSHSVKTPVSAIRQVLEDDTRVLDQELRQQLAQRLSDIDRQLESEMRRSRFAGPQAGKAAKPVSQARDLLWMLGRLYPDKNFELETELGPETSWPIEEHDLNEILGNLVDNAGKWSATGAELSLTESAGELVITVEDDGPGVSADALPTLGNRGVRLDEQTPGHGLGLAIVREITDRYGGSLLFSIGTRGGLRASVSLPKARTAGVTHHENR